MSDRPTVLVVDDQERVVQAFELWLAEDYDVRTATGGEAALEAVDEAVDVVLLDRHMPGLTGDEVLERIRERGLDCRVAVVTGVDPDFDILELPFDEYVEKPVDEEALRAVVERMLRVTAYDDRFGRLYGLAEKLATLEAEKTPGELADSEEYQRLQAERRELETETDDLLTAMEPEDHAMLFGRFS